MFTENTLSKAVNLVTIEKKAILELRNELINRILSGQKLDKKIIDRLKREIGKKYRLSRLPRDYEILTYLPPKYANLLKNILKNKPVRSLSGVVVVAVMTKPLPCPGRCIYCPGGIKNPNPTPQSYTGHEPAARRAYQLNYDPFKQVMHRIRQLEAIGHDVQKIEIIIMGGTFISAPESYKKMFIRGVYEGLLGKKYPNRSLKELQHLLETSKYRLVGLTIETRPDFCYEKEINEMLFYGATRVEIGVQILDDEILTLIKRNHDVNAVRKAFRIAKDSGLKIVAHMMLNLPFSNPKKDFNSFMKLFNDPDFRPDMLKIYPTAIVKGTELYEMWKKSEYNPYDENKLVELIAKIKKMIPPWVRIQRIQRDIPLYVIEAGYTVGNLRQVVKEYMKRKGWKCRCIRCREVGLNHYKSGIKPERINFITRKYEASLGEEIFISAEDIKRDIIIGFIRLRKPSEFAHRREITQNTMIVRELHVYGSALPIGRHNDASWQHRGYGAKLLSLAEEIASSEYDANKLVIISGIGVREYYRRFGYKLEGVYMSKKIE